MQVFSILNVKVYADEKEFCEKELTKYVEKYRADLKPLTLVERAVRLLPADKVEIETWTCDKFERIRRITGYLVGSMDSWNNAKRAEESERVKHL